MNAPLDSSVAAGYAAAYSGAILLDRSLEGRFELTDRDRLDLLHRMSTNDVAHLRAGEGRATVLTTALARIIDQLIVYERGRVTLAVCGVGRTAAVRGWLQRHIFFQDKVQTRDVSAETCQFGLFGAAAEAAAAAFFTAFSEEAPAATLPRHHFHEISIGGCSVLAARSSTIAGGGFTLIGPAAARDTIAAAFRQIPGVMLFEAGAEADTLYELLRIEAGLPLAGHELTEGYLPLEAGLWNAISFAKGCYIGQEIIARMESRHKLARTLARLSLNAPVPVGAALALAAQPDRVVGTVTSAVQRPDGVTVALGYIKMDAVEAPLVVVSDGDRLPVTSLAAAQWHVPAV